MPCEQTLSQMLSSAQSLGGKVKEVVTTISSGVDW